MIDLSKLEELARAATGGPWFSSDWSDDFGSNKTTVEAHIAENLHEGRSSIWPGGVQKLRIAECEEGMRPLVDARYISAANPAATLELIALIRKQEAELAEARAANERASGPLPDLPEWTKRDDLGGLVPSEVQQSVTVLMREAWNRGLNAGLAESANSGTFQGAATVKESLQVAPAAQANAGPVPGDMPMDRFVAALPLPVYSATPAQDAGELPPLPEPSTRTWILPTGVYPGLRVEITGRTDDQMRTYGQQCRAAGIEAAAKVAEDTDIATLVWAMQLVDDGIRTRADIAAAIRALIKKD